MASLIVAGLQSAGIQIVRDNSLPKFDLDSLHKQLLVWHTNKGIDVSNNYSPIRSTLGATATTVSLDPKENFNVSVRMLTGKTFEIPANKNTLVSEIKEKIYQTGDIHPDQQKLVFSGEILESGRTLMEHKLMCDSTVHMIVRSKDGGEAAKPYCLDDKVMLDPSYDYTYPSRGETGEQYQRGGINFQRPYGYIKKALKVLGRYDSDTWLGVHGSTNRMSSVSGEWPVSYHGTKNEFAESISKNGYELSKGKRFAYGRGIYSTPTPSIAEAYATTFKSEGISYKMIVMNRVNMDSTRVVKVEGNGVYYVTSEEKDVRPYALLFKKS